MLQRCYQGFSISLFPKGNTSIQRQVSSTCLSKSMQQCLIIHILCNSYISLPACVSPSSHRGTRLNCTRVARSCCHLVRWWSWFLCKAIYLSQAVVGTYLITMDMSDEANCGHLISARTGTDQGNLTL